jgi:hypothetical protein
VCGTGAGFDAEEEAVPVEKVVALLRRLCVPVSWSYAFTAFVSTPAGELERTDAGTLSAAAGALRGAVDATVSAAKDERGDREAVLGRAVALVVVLLALLLGDLCAVRVLRGSSRSSSMLTRTIPLTSRSSTSLSSKSSLGLDLFAPTGARVALLAPLKDAIGEICGREARLALLCPAFGDTGLVGVVSSKLSDIFIPNAGPGAAAVACPVVRAGPVGPTASGLPSEGMDNSGAGLSLLVKLFPGFAGVKVDTRDGAVAAEGTADAPAPKAWLDSFPTVFGACAVVDPGGAGLLKEKLSLRLYRLRFIKASSLEESSESAWNAAAFGGTFLSTAENGSTTAYCRIKHNDESLNHIVDSTERTNLTFLGTEVTPPRPRAMSRSFSLGMLAGPAPSDPGPDPVSPSPNPLPGDVSSCLPQ